DSSNLNVVDVVIHATDASKNQMALAETTPYDENNPFPKLFNRITSLSKLEDNWNSYGAAAPNRTALFWARGVLRMLYEANFVLRAVKASPDEGVGIIFLANDKQASIECLNTGDVFLIHSLSGELQVRPLESREHVEQAIGELQ